MASAEVFMHFVSYRTHQTYSQGNPVEVLMEATSIITEACIDSCKFITCASSVSSQQRDYKAADPHSWVKLNLKPQLLSQTHAARLMTWINHPLENFIETSKTRLKVTENLVKFHSPKQPKTRHTT